MQGNRRRSGADILTATYRYNDGTGNGDKLIWEEVSTTIPYALDRLVHRGHRTCSKRDFAGDAGSSIYDAQDDPPAPTSDCACHQPCLLISTGVQDEA